MAGGKEEYNAFFYSLVSIDTQVCIYSMPGHIFIHRIMHSLKNKTIIYLSCIVHFVIIVFAGDVLLN